MRMGKFSFLALIILALLVMAGHAVPAFAQGLFALDVSHEVITKWHPEPWPTVPFGSLRLWDSDTFWDRVNPSNGVYDWSVLDAWLAKANTGQQHVLYTIGHTPAWASSNPNDNTCIGGPGTCDPPNDLNADVTAIATHSANSPTAHIEAWEIWNEPFNSWEWTGTIPQMVRMASDAAAIIKSIDPNATVLTPTFAYGWEKYLQWMASYLAQGGGTYADAIALHGYVFDRGGTHGEPENLLPYLANFKAVLQAYGQDAKPIWDTEASWGDSVKTGFTDPDLQAGWLARFYILHRSTHIRRLFWFAYNMPDLATLWIPDPNDHRLPGTLLKPGKAFAAIHSWLVFAHVTAPCSANSTIWTCGLSRDDGSQALILWDTGESCS